VAGEVRSVVVRLSASVAGYLSGMGQADAATAKVEHGLQRLSKNTISTEKAMGRIGKVGGRLFLGAAAGIAVAEKKATDFNAEMATVYTLSHANTRQQELLAKAAKTVGINIGVGATDAARAEEELVKAGVSLKDIMGGGLKGALDLAAAGQTDVGTATEVAASAMTQFKLKGKDVPHIADLLAAGADKALGSVTDLGYGLGQVGTTAHQMGFSIEETTGTLAEFAQSGLLGEKGGATLKQMYLQLASPTKKASDLMKELGLSLYESNGQIKTMPALAGSLQRAFGHLDPATRNYALGVIFGSRAIQGANILIRDGIQGNKKWIDSVNDQGFAAHQASGKMNSLKGDLQKLNAELGNAFIEQGGKQGFLRGLTQDATKLVKKYNQLSDTQKKLVGKGFVSAAAVGGLLWTANKVYKISKDTAEVYRALFKTKAATSAVEAVAGGGLGKKAGVVPVFVTNEGFGGPGGVGSAGKGAGAAEGAAVGAAAAGAKKSKGAYALDALAGAIAFSFAQSVSDQLAKVGDRGNEKGPLSQFSKGRNPATAAVFGGTSHTLENDANKALGAQRFGGVFSKLDTTLAKPFGGDGLTKSLANIKELDKTLAAMYAKDPAKAQKAYDDALDKSGVSAKKFASILPKATHAMQAATGSSKWLDDLTGGLKKAVVQGSLYEKRIKSIPKDLRLYVSTPGAVTSIKDMGDLARAYHLTPKQIRTIMQLQGFSEAEGRAAAVGKAFFKLPKQVRTKVLADTVKSRFDVANLQRQYHLTPAQVRTLFKATGVDTVRQAAAAARAALASIPKTVWVDIKGRNHVNYGSAGANGLKNPDGSTGGGADGMTVPKSGRAYADRYHVMVADGEEIISNRYGQADQFRRDRATGRIPRYAAGGTVGTSAVSGGTGTRAVTVTFPPPAVYAAAVKAADDIAAAAIKTTATAKDLRAVHLDDLHQQQTIRDLQKSLNEHTKKKGYTLKGKLNRATAKAELADAKATLVEMRKQSDVAKQLADAQAAARQAQQDARKDATSTITGGVDLLSRSAGGSAAYVDRIAADVAKFGNVLARLRGAGVSPILLQQMVDRANTGDFRSATRFGQALLDQPALLAQLNTSLSSFSQIAGGVANLSTDPRFLTTAAWNPTGQVASTKVEVQLGVDPSTWTTDITRRVTANVLAAINGGR
jgi:TP901 family phage tail tape measure protein